MAKSKFFKIDITDNEVINMETELNKEAKEKLKSNVLNIIAKESGKKVYRYSRRWRAVLVAAVLIIAFATTSVFASVSNYELFKNNNVTDATESTTASPTEETKIEKETNVQEEIVAPQLIVPEKKHVDISFDYIDGYAVINNENGWYTFDHKDGYASGLDFECELIHIDSKDILEKIIKKGYKWEIFAVGNRTAYYFPVENHKFYTQQILVLYDDMDYILNFMAGENLDRTDFIEYSSAVELQETTVEKADYYVKLTDFYEYTFETQVDETQKNVKEEDIYNTNEEVNYQNCMYQVEGVTVYNNISEFTQGEILDTRSGFNSTLLVHMSSIVDQQGNLLPYYRRESVKGDGYSSPEQKFIADAFVNQKFIMVQLKVKNLENDQVKVNAGYAINYLDEIDGVKKMTERRFSRETIQKICQQQKTPAYYHNSVDGEITLDPQEETVLYMGYFVDEDRLENAYLSVGTYRTEESVTTPQIYIGNETTVLSP